MSERLSPALNALEAFLWRSRFLVILAVLASLVMTLSLMMVAIADTASLAKAAFHYFASEVPDEAHGKASAQVVAYAVRSVDGFLLATVMFIFGIGLYDLFIRRIQQSRGSARYSRIMEIRNLEDLKSRLGKVIILILVVKLFEHMLAVPIERALDVLLMGGAVLLMAAALFISHAESRGRQEMQAREEREG